MSRYSFADWDDEKRHIATSLWDRGAVKLRLSPGDGFRVRGSKRLLPYTLHLTDMLRDELVPEALVFKIGLALNRLIRSVRPETTAVSGVPKDGIPLVAATLKAAELMNHAKKYGVVHLEKVYEQGMDPYLRISDYSGTFPGKGRNVLALIDDAITNGDTKVQAIELLRTAGHASIASFNLIDREEGGVDRLVKKGVEAHSLFTVRELFAYWLFTGQLIQADYDRVIDRLNEPVMTTT